MHTRPSSGAEDKIDKTIRNLSLSLIVNWEFTRTKGVKVLDTTVLMDTGKESRRSSSRNLVKEKLRFLTVG